MQVRIIFLSIVALFALASAGSAETCAGNDGGLGVSRIVEIDAAGGPLYGDFTHRAKEPSFLGLKEVVLTFDDGPLPAVTRSILDTLDRFCTKATFFRRAHGGRLPVDRAERCRAAIRSAGTRGRIH